MKRTLLTGAVGAAAMYLADRRHGKERRQRVLGASRTVAQATLQAGRKGARAVEPISPIPAQLLGRIDPGTRTRRGRGARRVRRLALGGGLGLVVRYLLDPAEGSRRQERVTAAARTVAGQASTTGRTAVSALAGVIRPAVDQAKPRKRAATTKRS